MADWKGSRTGGFFYREVEWPTFKEVGDYQHATGGSLEMSALSDVKVNGSLSFDGEPPNPANLLRVFYGFTDAEGRYEEVAVATMGVIAANPTVSDGIDGVQMKGKAKLTSMLQILKDVELNRPYTVKAGEQAIAKAMALIADCGLPTNSPDPSAYALSKEWTVAPEDANVLSIVNKLLGFAGYSSAWVDAYGVVQLTPYVEPTDREATIRFSAGPDSIIRPEMGSENDWGDTPNVVRLSYSTDSEFLAAWCKNVDPAHKASLPSRGGREKTHSEQVSQLAGDTAQERLANLKEMARSTLAANSAEVEYAEVDCAFMPVEPNDAAEVDYAGVSWKGAVMSCKVDLGDDSSEKVRVRRFVRTALEVETGGEILWQQ